MSSDGAVAITITEEILDFPVVAFSPSGWINEAATLDELTSASVDDPLTDWQGLEIFDSCGKKFIVRRAFVRSPTSLLGRCATKIFNSNVYLSFELTPPQSISVTELLQRLSQHYRQLETDSTMTTHRRILEAISS